MQGNIPHASGSAVSQLLQIIKDFSSFLENRKQSKQTFLPVSESSQSLMKNWGRVSVPDTVFSFEGPPNAAVFIIDSEGGFFKGEAGQLLVKILGAMNLSPDQVFICNAQVPEAVHSKIREMSPGIIVTLGTKAGQLVLDVPSPVDQFRGKFHEYQGIRVMPTFHPSRLLKHPENKREVWDDMKQVMAYAGLP
ncbi:MAG: uracil-DNA glycosylase [Proteobacteria bacterium]|nr:uracil-DNA glycosylase [Pseudomonadota bacterium]MBU1388810.1 uracil-DNA glycosylase [Pseudomonadota bacterium]MBU1543151.1 uracil-DNA glycosylase [Pseudomonadota bacterium]MBU2482588.1 uracil-DNA glycosylase [Pseudomonadota bacterium]